MKPHSEHFNLPTSAVEARKIRKQEKCEHVEHKKVYANPAMPEKYMIICCSCSKVMGSEKLSTPKTLRSKEIVL